MQDGDVTEPRVLVLHYGGSSTQKVKFYPSSSREELLCGIRELFLLPKDAPLRFRDADGDIVLFTTSFPSGTTLHMSVAEGLPLETSYECEMEDIKAEPQERPWRACWKAHSDKVSLDLVTQTITVANGSADFCEPWQCFSNPIPKTGNYYIVLDLNLDLAVRASA
eukprot:CAMPEP_0174255122 /NCGR_PEP_ID=MMETSP0439-20130205/4454_1 /TAXON_ID=0 /ORGANISM="Stereomyxa ramosa, Strain Chinc5" /LENGTH=165 /DNA_ID=CAMNT_0015337149 /DNA_START=59 /DNA_END=557 /DNA_ORIENTATION=+